jgi:hypothetical protein
MRAPDQFRRVFLFGGLSCTGLWPPRAAAMQTIYESAREHKSVSILQELFFRIDCHPSSTKPDS